MKVGIPSYRFECRKCSSVYEDLVKFDPSGKYKDVSCPECGSKRKNQLATACEFCFSNPEGTSRWISSSRGHDYRYKHKQPSVRMEREMAEKRSHMGSSKEIYKELNDLKNDKNFDFSKI